MVSPDAQDLHEYVSFVSPTDPEQTWVFDLTFLESNYACIFGRGCKGVYPEDATEKGEGCCSHGAHLLDKADRKNLAAHVERLRPDQWQFHDVAEKKGYTKKNDEGALMTRVHKGACIFLNRPDFHLGAGCALHVAAVEAGERFLEWKPFVCWLVPLHQSHEVDDNNHTTTIIREWKRRDWGEGGEEFHWWCTETSEAFNDKKQVWQTMRDELTELVGEASYDLLVEHIKKRAKGERVVKFSKTRRSTATSRS